MFSTLPLKKDACHRPHKQVFTLSHTSHAISDTASNTPSFNFQSFFSCHPSTLTHAGNVKTTRFHFLQYLKNVWERTSPVLRRPPNPGTTSHSLSQTRQTLSLTDPLHCYCCWMTFGPTCVCVNACESLAWKWFAHHFFDGFPAKGSKTRILENTGKVTRTDL